MARIDAHLKITEYFPKPLDDFKRIVNTKLNGRKLIHWPLEFPEIFECGGFNAFVGNPPFSAVRLFADRLGQEYTRFLFSDVPEATGNVDLSSFFIRKAHKLLCEGGCAGLIATKSISEGATKRATLVPICKNASIYNASKLLPWPGTANVYVAIIHFRIGKWLGSRNLNGIRCDSISSSLKPEMERPAPHRLRASKYAFNRGSDWNGEGFLVDRGFVIEQCDSCPNAHKYLHPCLNAKEFCEQPEQNAGRWIIYFGNIKKEHVASESPNLLAALKERVYDHRSQSKDERLRRKWWLFRRPTVDLYKAAWQRDQVFVTPFIAKYLTFCQLPSKQIFGNTLTVFPNLDWDGFVVLQSSIHEEWARNYCGHLGSTLLYAPTDCFETFPMPDSLSNTGALGNEYHRRRKEIMTGLSIGITETYNLFHDPSKKSKELIQLRSLHVNMDKAVLQTYKWTDIKLDHNFHETERGVRYTISPPASKIILNRLLGLNQQRYVEEVAAGLHDKKSKVKKIKKNKVQDPKLF